MTKHRFRESIKSFFGHHVDPEKDEQLKGSKIEIDGKVTKILKLIKDEEAEENDGISIANSKKEPLVLLIEDFHKQYQNLYAQYDHLTGELRKKVHNKREKDAYSSSSSDSESDYSSKNGGSKNGQLESEFQKIAEGIKQELETANLEIADLKRKLTASSEEKDALNSDYLASLSKVQEVEEIIRNLKLESEIPESEKSKLVVENEELRHKLETDAKIEAEVNQRLEDLNRENNNLILVKETAVKTNQERVLQEKEGLMAQMKDLESEVNSLKNQKSELEEELRTKIEENGRLREEKVGLQGQIFELEKTLAERGVEFAALQEKHASAENETSSQLTTLVVQVNNLQQELDSSQTQRNELELQLEREKQESSKRLTEMENQKSDLESQINNQRRMLEEQGEANKKLAEEYKQVEGLYQECKANLEVAERKMEEMSEEFNRNVESKSRIAADLKQMVEDLQRDLEAKGDEKNDFINQITDHQRLLKEQEDAFNKLSEEYKQLETSFQDCKAIIEVTERKMQEMAGEHNKNVQSKDQIVADLEQIIEDLKRDLEMKGDEFSTLVENVRTIDVKLRLSNQKLRVTEQLLTENEDSFRKAEAKFLEEQRMLEERITTLSGIIAANNEAYSRMITDISENVISTLTGFEAVIHKFEEGYGNYEHCVEETSKELRIAKLWVEETKSEKKQLMDEMTNLIEQLKHQIEQESMLRERVEKLQIKANKEEEEKENLLKALKHLETKVEYLETAMKEKDQGILGLGEEKREAIRQLCVWIDYHRSRCDDLKEILSKTVRVQRAT